jgi:GNAT superfamily N-acetyltransferase
LEDYLRKQAGQDVKRQVAACFILEGKDGAIKGYYTLSADSVDRTLIPENLQKKLPYKNLPVTLLGRLARDTNYKGQGLGELLLADALRRAYQASASIGACAVVTDPINDKARVFYEGFGFISLENGRMFIPMETIKASIP